MKHCYKSSINEKTINLTNVLKRENVEFSLLSYSEYIQFIAIIPILSVNYDWWLRSINYYANEIFFANNNLVDTLSHAKADEIKGIRPIMIIDTKMDLKPKDIFKYGKFNWTVLTTCDKTIAICNDIVANRIFDKNNYIFDFVDTNIKNWLDNEFINLLFN